MSNDERIITGYYVASDETHEPDSLGQLFPPTDRAKLEESARLRGQALFRAELRFVQEVAEADFRIGGAHRAQRWTILPKAGSPDTPDTFWRHAVNEGRVTESSLYCGPMSGIMGVMHLADMLSRQGGFFETVEAVVKWANKGGDGWQRCYVTTDQVMGNSDDLRAPRWSDLDNIFRLSYRRGDDDICDVILSATASAHRAVDERLRRIIQLVVDDSREDPRNPTIGELLNLCDLSLEESGLMATVLSEGGDPDGGHPHPDRGSLPFFTSRYFLECAQRCWHRLTDQGQGNLERLLRRMKMYELYDWRTGALVHWRDWR